MVFRASVLHETDSYRNIPLAVAGVDYNLLKVMKAAVILELKRATAELDSKKDDVDEYAGIINYIRHLTDTLKEFEKSLKDIELVDQHEQGQTF